MFKNGKRCRFLAAVQLTLFILQWLTLDASMQFISFNPRSILILKIWYYFQVCPYIYFLLACSLVWCPTITCVLHLVLFFQSSMIFQKLCLGLILVRYLYTILFLNWYHVSNKSNIRLIYYNDNVLVDRK